MDLSSVPIIYVEQLTTTCNSKLQGIGHAMKCFITVQLSVVHRMGVAGGGSCNSARKEIRLGQSMVEEMA